MAFSVPSVRGLSLLVAVSAAFCVICSAQAGATDALPEVRLEVHQGKSMFYLGEPIRLDLVFENRTGSPFMLNTTEYGDISEKVEISPASGWFAWRTQSGHDFAALTKLGDTPLRVPVQLDEGFVFREPGEYRVKVTTARMLQGSTLTAGFVPPVTTNEVTIELRAMPPEVEAARVAAIRADLVNSDETRTGAQRRQGALRQLATLQGDEALAEKIKLFEEDNEQFRQVHGEAFATTRDLRKQLGMLEQAWTDPKLTPQYDGPDALSETRRLLAGRSLGGWHMTGAPQAPDAVEQRLAEENRADMAALLDSMPARSGESRTMAAYFLIEFGGLDEARRARAVDYAVEEFPRMDDTAQHMLLETSRPPLRDPRLVPFLKSMLAANPSDKDAAAGLLAMAPADSATWIVSAVCAPKVVLLDTFKDAAVDRVPGVDACLTPLLRVAPSQPRDAFEWKQRATAAARFGTPALVPVVRETWRSSDQDGAVLAVLMRDDPAGAVELLSKRASEGTLDGMLYETQAVYRQISEPFPEPVQRWLRVKLTDGTDKEASTAAYALSVGGDASDVARVEQRLGRLRAQWQGRELTQEARQAEMELASALGTYGSKTFLGPEERHELGQGCLSEQCRVYLH